MTKKDIINQFRRIAEILSRIPQPSDCSKLSEDEFRALTNLNTAKAKAMEMAVYLDDYDIEEEDILLDLYRYAAGAGEQPEA